MKFPVKPKRFRKKKSVLDRFEKLCVPEPNSGCVIWIGGRSANGYGMFWAHGEVVAAHAFAYAEKHGAIPDHLELDHTCRNRSCVNPRHLEPVTHLENVLRGKLGDLKTHCIRGHSLDGEGNVYVTSLGHRQCRECKKIRYKEDKTP